MTTEQTMRENSIDKEVMLNLLRTNQVCTVIEWVIDQHNAQAAEIVELREHSYSQESAINGILKRLWKLENLKHQQPPGVEELQQQLADVKKLNFRADYEAAHAALETALERNGRLEKQLAAMTKERDEALKDAHAANVLWHDAENDRSELIQCLETARREKARSNESEERLIADRDRLAAELELINQRLITEQKTADKWYDKCLDRSDDRDRLSAELDAMTIDLNASRDLVEEWKKRDNEMVIFCQRLQSELAELKAAKVDAVQYFIDRDYGDLWKGPIKSTDNLHYAKLSGVCEVDCSLIWVLYASDRDPKWIPASHDVVEQTFQNAWKSFWKRQPDAPAATPSDTPKSRPFDEIHEEYRKKLMPQDATASDEPVFIDGHYGVGFGFSGRPLCPKCHSEEGVHGGCTCGYLSARGITTVSEPTVEWWSYVDSMDEEWFYEIFTDDTVAQYNQDGKPFAHRGGGDPKWIRNNSARFPRIPEAVRRYREEHEESPAQTVEVTLRKRIDELETECIRLESAGVAKISQLKTHLAERDKKIAELTPLADAMRWLESDMVNLDWDENIGEWDLWDGRKTYHGNTILEAIAAARAGK